MASPPRAALGYLFERNGIHINFCVYDVVAGQLINIYLHPVENALDKDEEEGGYGWLWVAMGGGLQDSRLKVNKMLQDNLCRISICERPFTKIWAYPSDPASAPALPCPALPRGFIFLGKSLTINNLCAAANDNEKATPMQKYQQENN